MMSIHDPYAAYCLDEAGAYLLMQAKPPNYRRAALRPANRDRRQLQLLRRVGADVRL